MTTAEDKDIMTKTNPHVTELDPTPLQLVLSRLPDAKRSGKSWKARCPAHDDHTPSLSIAEGDRGDVLLHCHAGCDTTDVVAALGLALSNLFTGNLDPETKRTYARSKAQEKVREVALVHEMAANSEGPLSDEDQAFLEEKTKEGERAKAVLARLDAVPVLAATETQGIFMVSPTGVRALPPEGKDEPATWVCAELRIRANTRNGESEDWGRLLEWKDLDGHLHRWIMPFDHLQGDGTDVRRELARRGLPLGTGKKAREFLLAYLQSWRVKERARCVTQPGWCGDSYVAPTEAIGPTVEPIFFVNNHGATPCWSESGTLEEWQRLVAAPAAGNTRLVFALSTAFAGPLLNVVNEDSGGIHLRGSSSSGKSTALRMAASVWGQPKEYCRLWRATTNALEGLAALHNDGLLILDELSQIRPEDAGEAAYLLANGQGKSRANRTAATRKIPTWRLLFLSAGEISLASHLESGGRQANAGQELRLAEIEADAGMNMGILENLHGHADPGALIDAINQASGQVYGVAGPAYLRELTAQLPELRERIHRRIKEFCEKHVPHATTSQVRRVAARFAVVAIAGELGTYMGITGWSHGEAENAAAVCFKSWLDNFGSEQMREFTMMLKRIRNLFLNEASRFQSIRGAEYDKIHNRAGYFNNQADSEREHYVFLDVFKREICVNIDERAAGEYLLNRGWLIPDTDGRRNQKPRIYGVSTRVYVFSSKAIEEEI